MVTIEFKDSKGYTTEIVATGHANYAEIGKDIVCSAVSAILTGLINELGRYCEIDHSVNSGNFKVRIREPDEKTQIITEFVENTLQDIADTYPDNVTVTNK